MMCAFGGGTYSKWQEFTTEEGAALAGQARFFGRMQARPK